MPSHDVSLASTADGTVCRRLDDLGVLPEHSAGVLRLVRCPALVADGELVVVDGDVKSLVRDVELDPVAIADECDGAAVDRLGGDVADAEPGRATGETTVGEEQHVLAEPGTLDGARNGEHLPHPGTALRAFVPDHHHVAGDDLPRLEGVHGRTLPVEDACS